MSETISVRNLFKIFGDAEPDRALEMVRAGADKDAILAETGMVVGVKDVSFDVREGEIFVVMGLSGSGKSTLVRMLNRLIEPTAGEVLIDGEDVVAADAETLRRIRLEKMAMVFQHFALFPHKTVAENVAYGLKARGVDRRERRARAGEALERVGLEAWADSRTSALSGGMQQRVGLARALAVDPQILLMDEPFSALDPLIRRDMQLELLHLQRELKKTIVFITHDLNEALLLGDRIAIMKEGAFVQVGAPPEIVAKPADEYVAAFTQDIDRARVFAVESVAEPPHALELGVDTAGTAIERMERLGRDALYVVQQGRPVGVVAYRALASSGGNGADLEAALIRDFPSAGPDTHLYRLYRASAAGLPVAVVGEDGALAGVAEPRAILAQLAAEGPDPEDASAPAGPRSGESAAAAV